MKCFYHNENEATAQCTNCGKYICTECCMQENATLKILCPDCANAVNKQYEAQVKTEIKDYKKFKIKWLIIYVGVTILGLIFSTIGLSMVTGYMGSNELRYFFNNTNFLEKLLVMTIGGIPGAIAMAICGMPTSNEEKILREVNRLRFDNGCLALIVEVIFSCILGYLFYAVAIVCSVIVIVQLILFYNKNKNSNS